MPKLTETFNDKAKKSGNGVHVVAAHEPIQDPGTMPWAFTGPTVNPVLAENVVIEAPPKAVLAEKKPLKIALIGTAPSSRMLAPYNDPSWTIWACSPGNMSQIPRVDAWFELHGNLLWPENKHYGEPYIEWLKKLTIPVYMQDQGYCPNAITFPKIDLVREFGRDFFTSSFTWMMAFAMKQGASEIALYGIDMASRDEYILQRPGFYFFRHIAETRGIKVSAPHESDIMQSPGLYGYSDVMPFGRKLAARRNEIRGRLGGMRGERDKMVQSITYLEGADEDIDYFQSIWSGVADELLLLQAENAELKAKLSGLGQGQGA